MANRDDASTNSQGSASSHGADGRVRGDGDSSAQGASDQERTLVAEARSGEFSAISDLLERYQRRVFGVCYRMTGNADDAADLTQDTLVKVMTNLDRFHGRSAFSTWVIRIAMNVTLSHLRRERKRRETLQSGRIGDAAKTAPMSGGGDHEKMGELSNARSVEQDEMSRRLTTGLAAISEEYRALLILRDVNGLEYQQIAEVFAIPIGTVKSRLFRARLALRKILAEHEEGGPESDINSAALIDAATAEPR